MISGVFAAIVEFFNSPVFQWIACIIAALSVLMGCAIAVVFVIIFVNAIKQIREQERKK